MNTNTTKMARVELTHLINEAQLDLDSRVGRNTLLASGQSVRPIGRRGTLIAEITMRLAPRGLALSSVTRFYVNPRPFERRAISRKAALSLLSRE